MSVDKEQPSTSEKKIIFCEVCKVACVSEDGLHLHNESERHKRMEEFTFGGNMFYKSLEDFIACPTRKEPVIGLQYLMQQHPNQNHPKAFMCSMCEKVGKLSHMIKHLKSYRHRLNYMGRHYKDLFPLFKKYTPYYKRELKVRDHASEIERKEASSKTQISTTESQEGEIKNDYLKYLVKRHKELNTWNKKAFILNEHKKQVLQFMETFAVASQKEATWVQKLAEDMEDAMRVFRLNFNKSQSRAANLNKANHGSEDRKPTDLPGRKRQKRKAPWKDELPKKVPTQTSRGFGGETSKSITTETSQVIPLCDDSSEENSQTTGNKKEPSQGTPQKQEWVCRGKRTGFGHGIWDTLVNSEKSSQTSSLMWRSKYPHNKSQSACNNSDGNHVAETRRASTELLSSFTFSLSAFENSSSLPVPSQSVFQNLLGKGKIYQGNSDLQNQHGNAEERMEQGIPHAPKCMDSNTEQINQTREPLHEREDSVTNSAQHSDEEMDPSQHSDLENSPLHYSDVQSHLDEHIVLDEYTDVNNECGYEGSDGSPAKYSDLESSLGLDLAEAGKC